MKASDSKGYGLRYVSFSPWVYYAMSNNMTEISQRGDTSVEGRWGTCFEVGRVVLGVRWCAGAVWGGLRVERRQAR